MGVGKLLRPNLNPFEHTAEQVTGVLSRFQGHLEAPFDFKSQLDVTKKNSKSLLSAGQTDAKDRRDKGLQLGLLGQ